MVLSVVFILNGREIAERIKESLKKRAGEFEKTHGRKCALAVVLVGNLLPSEIYVRNKEKACNEVGISPNIVRFGETVAQDELCSAIEKLNADKKIDGIIVQLPLPKHIDMARILQTVDPAKDVDGFHPVNVGRLSAGQAGFVPATALGVLELIKSTGVNLAGKHAVVVGRSNIVGKPVAQLLLNADCTVTVAHSKTSDLKAHTKTADILVVAAGSPKLITRDMVKKGAIVIDVGINRAVTADSNGGAPKISICGDVDFENVKHVASFITPVPGGVGPLTVAMLLVNVLGGGF
jgi:methylenetetrahydrofolate dehydrogenase (NADP+)/methenyltetrahydrofolate cyclohydrolase